MRVYVLVYGVSVMFWDMLMVGESDCMLLALKDQCLCSVKGRSFVGGEK